MTGEGASEERDRHSAEVLEVMLPASPFPGVKSLKERTERALRVDLAGEKGAEAIYAGQLWALKNHPLVPLIQEMAEQEAAHARGFEVLIKARHVRPSLLAPLWEKAGFFLGALTGLAGGNAAMACTTAVEEVIDKHYQEQIQDLEREDPALGAFLEQCRADEAAHLETGLHHGANEVPFSRSLQAAIRLGTRFAIFVAKRL